MRDPINVHEKIVDDLARTQCEKISRAVIIGIQRMKDSLLVGEHYTFDSRESTGLQNVWDEICVQKIEAEYSSYWEFFDIEVINLIQREVSKLPSYVKQAIWLQTDSALNSDSQDENINDDDVCRYIADDYVYEAARRWKNKRISRYLHGEWATLFY